MNDNKMESLDLTAYGLISVVEKNGGYANKVVFEGDCKELGISKESIKNAFHSGILREEDENITTGPEANEYLRAENLSRAWLEVSPRIRQNFVEQKTEYPPQLKESLIWRVATSPTGKVWCNALEMYYIYRKSGGNCSRVLKGERYTGVIETIKERQTRKIKKYEDISLSRMDKLRYQEYLISADKGFIPKLAEEIFSAGLSEVRRSDFSLNEVEIVELKQSYEEVKKIKAKKAEDDFEHLKQKLEIIEKPSNTTKADFNKAQNLWTIVKEDRPLELIDRKKCLLGLDAEKCAWEWKFNDSMDAFAYADRFDARLFLSAFYSGLYILPKKMVVIVPKEEFINLVQLVSTLRPQFWNAKKEAGNYTWTVGGQGVELSFEEHDNLHPPYNENYFLPRLTMEKIQNKF